MKIISTIKEFRLWRKQIIGSIGFVPTMGALHNGHFSLVKQSKKACKTTIVTIFVNPTQFAPNEDLETYPKNIDLDIKQLIPFQIDCLFLPRASEIYPIGFSTEIDVVGFSKLLEGKSRPNFFKGVATIVSKLFNIVEPSHSFFGEKDAQQVRIIQQMVTDMNYPIKIISCPIIREKNGLAMSSRNQHLSKDEFKMASKLYSALKTGKNLIINGEKNVNTIKDKIIEIISAERSLVIDYISISNNQTLEEYNDIIDNDILVSIAVYVGDIRLIDNFSYTFLLK